jgi:predicted nucleic acid-binding protein
MIAVDTSSLIAYLEGEQGQDIAAITSAIQSGALVLPPVVIAEVVSGNPGSRSVANLLDTLPMLPILPGYWERSGLMRARNLKQRLKTKIADALIAQSCIDHDVALITRDTDFRHYEKHCGLKLA